MIYAIILAFLLIASPASAACTGASPSWTCSVWADIQTLHNGSLVNGDTINIPAGSISATSKLTTTKWFTLKGAGFTSTTITFNITNSDLVGITESTAGSVRVEGIKWVFGTGPNTGDYRFIRVTAAASGKPVLITATRFEVGGGNALGFESPRGVIWLNEFESASFTSGCLNQAAALRHKPSGAWATNSTFGNLATNDNTLYFENNWSKNVQQWIDIDDSARTVIRFNTVINSGSVVHGTDTSAIGGRYGEYYKNLFQFDTTTLPAPCSNVANVDNLINARNGTALILDNTIPDVTSGAWGNKTELRLSVEWLRRATGSYGCWTGGYPGPHQAGWGCTNSTCDSGNSTQAGSSGLYQTLQPVVVAGNFGGGNYTALELVSYACNDSSFSCDYPNQAACAARPAASDFLVANVDYYNQAASFTGASGTGFGTRAARPATCTTGVYYWSNDQGSWNTSGSTGGGATLQGVLDKCTSTNTWTDAWYTPAPYPNSLTTGDIVSPSNLTISGKVDLDGKVSFP